MVSIGIYMGVCQDVWCCNCQTKVKTSPDFTPTEVIVAAVLNFLPTTMASKVEFRCKTCNHCIATKYPLGTTPPGATTWGWGVGLDYCAAQLVGNDGNNHSCGDS
eukprot:TRINITY_DN67312_c6_g1_i1.p3 TRINITY_DN67312_c6_g1~~TRINITY_DN67312_c6_g1_i1.p3  ORF type:complete len:105 (+),score=13.68 TRINITY_DN67312_c6_g1_i1:56-370(+)